MNEYLRKSSNENNEPKSAYNVNSFRGLYSDKHKNDIKSANNVMSARLVFQSVEKSEKDSENKNKRDLKPKLLTSRLPAPFGTKYQR